MGAPLDASAPADRSRTEAARPGSEADYGALFRALDQPLAVVEVIVDERGEPVDYRFIDVNPAFERATGVYGANGRTALELGRDVDRDAIATYGSVAETGERARLVYQPQSGGQARAFDVIPFGDAVLRRVGVVAADVALDREAADPALRSEALLQRAISIGTVGVIFFRTDGSITDANDAFLRMAGVTRADVIAGRVRWDLLTPPEFMEVSLNAVREFTELGETTPYEKQYKRPDGSRWWALFAAKRIDPDLGIEFVIDVTRQREAEARRAAAENRLRTVIGAITDYGIFALDAEGRITEWTDGAQRVTGYAAEEVVGRHESMFSPPEEAMGGAFGGELEEAAAFGRAERRGSRIRKGGEGYWANEVVSAIRDADGRLQGFTKVCRDESHQQRVEIERDQLLERERRAREAAEAYLGVISHELKTPVTTILGSASILARHPERVQELARDIEDESERLVRIVDDLLVLSGVERGHLRLAPEPLLVSHAVAAVVTDVARRFPDVQVVVEDLPELAPVHADPTAVRQILTNLVTNACKYAGRDGPVRVVVTLHMDTAVVSVVDQGPGLGPDPEALFELFFRAPHTRKLASGTGIGLYVARALAQAMGGTLSASNPPGGGGRFELSVPISREAVDAETDGLGASPDRRSQPLLSSATSSPSSD
jgi:PAS domain S-box-containing protein